MGGRALAAARAQVGLQRLALTVRHDRKFSTETRALLHWLNQAQAAAFNRWEEFVLERNMAAALARKALLSWTHQALRAGLNSWYAYLEELKRQHDLLFKAACMWSRIIAVRALNLWHWQLMEAQRRQELMYKAMFRWAHRALVASFDTWRINCSGLGDEEEGMMIAEQHWTFSNLSVFLFWWRNFLDAAGMRSDEDRLKADEHRRRMLMQKAFLGLVDLVSQPKPAKSPTPSPPVSPPKELARAGPHSRVARAVDPYGLFSVIINRTAYGKQDRALYYVIDIKLEGRTEYDLNKRYRDFDLLNAVLTDRFAGILRSSTKGMPVLPPKKSFTKLNPEFYEQRAQELHQYIQDLISFPEIAGSEELCEFLQFHAHL